MIECPNTTCARFHRNDDCNTCENCQKNYIVSIEEYKAKRPANGRYVFGFLVRNKKDNSIQGILNERTSYQELAWIDEDSLELC